MKFFVDPALENCREVPLYKRRSILTNMLFKLDRLYKKFASYRLAVAKINPRQAGTRSDVFSLQHKSQPLLAEIFQRFLRDRDKF